MKDIVYLSKLFDFYGELLTEKQQENFKDYYFNDLTLSEISENALVSRAAIHKNLKEIETKLYYYEEKLKMVEKLEKIEELLKNTPVYDKLKEII